MRIVSGLLYSVLGFFVAWALFVPAPATSGAEPACAGFGDCFLKTQTLFAGLLAIGAAWVAYRGVIRQIAAADLRDEKKRQQELRELAETLAGTFEGLRYQFQTLRLRAAGYKARPGQQGRPTIAAVATDIRVLIPPVFESLEVRVGALGHEISASVVKARFAFDRLSQITNDWRQLPNANEAITDDGLDTLVALLAEIEDLCTNLRPVLQQAANTVEQSNGHQASL